MTRFTKIATFCALLALPAIGCDDRRVTKQDQDTDKSAEVAVKQTRELGKDLKTDLQKGDLARGIADVQTDVPAVAKAHQTFAEKRDVRVAILRGVHALHLTELAAMRGIRQTLAYTSSGEGMIDDKLLALSTELDLSGKMIAALPTANADEWAAKDDEVAAAMTKVVVALQDAQLALRDAPRQIAHPAT